MEFVDFACRTFGLCILQLSREVFPSVNISCFSLPEKTAPPSLHGKTEPSKTLIPRIPMLGIARTQHPTHYDETVCTASFQAFLFSQVLGSGFCLFCCFFCLFRSDFRCLHTFWRVSFFLRLGTPSISRFLSTSYVMLFHTFSGCVLNRFQHFSFFLGNRDGRSFRLT